MEHFVLTLHNYKFIKTFTFNQFSVNNVIYLDRLFINVLCAMHLLNIVDTNTLSYISYNLIQKFFVTFTDLKLQHETPRHSLKGLFKYF